MRCLQCGKGIPLLKRLGGSSEFCSEAHRREYQHEFSQLALGRLLQSQPSEFQAQPEKAPSLVGAATAALDGPPAAALNGVPPAYGILAATGAPTAVTPSPAPAWAETARPAATLSAPAAKPAESVASQPPPMIPAKNGISQPAMPEPAVSQSVVSPPATAPAAVIQKPAPAELQFALVAAPEFEHASASLAPGRPRHQPDMLLAALPHGVVVPWESGVEIANSITRPVESKLDLREMSRSNPRIALELRIVPPESLEIASQPLPITAEPAAPAEAAQWIGSHRDFTGELVSLGDFADAQFSKSDFEVPVLAGDSTVSASAEPLPAEPQAATPASQLPAEEMKTTPEELTTIASRPTVQIPAPQLDLLPMDSSGIAPGRTKPIPVFGPAPISIGTIQVPQPSGLPLRPVMVLAAAAAPAIETKNRGTDIRSTRSALSIKPELPPSTPAAALPPELNLGLPELPIPAPGEGTARTRKIIAAAAGVVVFGAGLFFFLGKPSDAGSKAPASAPAVGAPGSQWIANFAPDPKRQRRVSLLRSSLNLSAYRLDFESSIQIKALGWVYRAQDAKNFYVSKIEFQKPGVNPVYALVHYAVIDGVEQPRVETPLPVSVPMGGLYKVHFEAVGNRFTTWVQGQQVEQWTDARLSSGGAGLYGEGSEQSVLHGDFVVTPLQK